ncbi:MULTISPECIES: polyhydroxyalkanoic acid system family protein [unclassified Sphingomonas]|jgi:hypothetical protein|uniref:polyhydroxyalkanoic acid system family protein n=1 Tax=unclassified Sphingomonas TaxID=196159 RepID=UPI0008377153|nr:MULTISPECIES: polyhydroxyalkanoic acid system family protein [unclassified Sphingomonas]MCH4893633.1 hypothetical protein [Sphingomonas sp. SFZ2018-12]
MTEPIRIDLPHQLGTAGARARIDGAMADIERRLPAAKLADRRWAGDTLFVTVEMMGQKLATRADIHDSRVHLEIELPAILALFASRIREKIAKEGPKLLA